MMHLWKAWADAARMTLEAQQVIAMRGIKMQDGGPLAAVEAHRMVGEKMLAMWQSQAAIGLAMLGGRSVPVGKAMAPYKRAVSANRRRLGRKRRKS